MNVFMRGDASPYNFGSINIRCPACRHNGAFHPIAQVNDVAWQNVYRLPDGKPTSEHFKAGSRVCPNTDCRALVFFVEGKNAREIYPPEVLDFDATNLPLGLLSSLEEAIKCHAAGCFRAAALMVRRVLEELCEDKKATGANLKQRIAALSSVALIPTELLSAADELRILGNDAAHIEAKDYDQIGKEECEIAIELAKELLKAVYQYNSLVARLQALKKSSANP